MGRQIPDHSFVEVELAIGGKLDDDRAQHCIVWRSQRCTGNARSRETRSGMAAGQVAGAVRAVNSR